MYNHHGHGHGHGHDHVCGSCTNSDGTSNRGGSNTQKLPHHLSLTSLPPPAAAAMLDNAKCRLRRLCSRLSRADRHPPAEVALGRAYDPEPSIRLATFNAAMFSMAPAVPEPDGASPSSAGEAPSRGILKQRAPGRPRRRVSINLPDNEISLSSRGKAASRRWSDADAAPAGRSVLDALREAGADVVALQNVKAVEEKGMRPLSDLAEALGMRFVFAESWAPEYGNAILSRWPIKRCRVQRIFDDSDFRNVLRATIEVPRAGELNFHCTHLDHLDESWRMRQIEKILQLSDGPHVLAGGLNSLDDTDYSSDRWADIVKYYEEIGKPTPKTEVVRFLRERRYVDAKGFAGECEPVVVMAKGQDVQGTCKYGTRVDYILASPDSPYEFVPGSYVVLSSKATSDHHIVRVDLRLIRRRLQNVITDEKGGEGRR